MQVSLMLLNHYQHSFSSFFLLFLLHVYIFILYTWNKWIKSVMTSAVPYQYTGTSCHMSIVLAMPKTITETEMSIEGGVPGTILLL